MRKCYFICLLVCTMLAAACSSDELMENVPSTDGEGQRVEFGVSMPDDASSRIAIDDLKLTWETGDAITFFCLLPTEEVTPLDFTLVSGAGQKTARFAGVIPEGSQLFGYAYKSTYLEPDLSNIVFETEPSEVPVQKGFNSMGHLRDFLLMTNQGDVQTEVTPQDLANGLALTHKNAFLRINLKYLPEDFKDLKKVSCLVENELSMSMIGSVCFEGDISELANNKDHYLYMAVHRSEVRPGGRVILIFEGTDVGYEVSVVSPNGKEYVNGYRYDLPVTKDEANTMHAWKQYLFKDKPRYNEVWIKTVGDKVPSKSFWWLAYNSFYLQPDKNELGWYVYRSEEDSPLLFFPAIKDNFINELSEVYLPAYCKSLRRGAFSHSTALTKITLPDHLSIIEESAFYNCDKLESITIPASVTKVSEHAFDGCSILKEVVFSKDSKLTEIGNFAFADTNLKELVIPRNVSKVPSGLHEPFIVDRGSLEKLTVLAPNTVLQNNPYLSVIQKPNCKLYLDISWKQDARCDKASCQWFNNPYLSINFIDADGNVIE